MDVHVKILADDIWEAEDDKTVFLGVVVESFDWLYLKERPISLPMVKISTEKENMRNEDKWERSKNWNMRFFMNDQSIMFGYTPYGKTLKKMSIN